MQYLFLTYGNILTTLDQKITAIDADEAWNTLHIKATMLYGSDSLGVSNWQALPSWQGGAGGGLIAKRTLTHTGLDNSDNFPTEEDYTGTVITSTAPTNYARHLEGTKRYELKNHLGNVLATVSDKRDVVVDGLAVEYYRPKVDNVSFYYPFGSLMPGLSDFGNEHRFGFNGMEKDDEMKGNGNSLDFGARIYDPRIGRWLSVDPHQKNYTALSPYNFSLNSPLLFKDSDGLDALVTVQKDPNGGGQIIISSTIYITGEKANAYNAKEYTKKAQKLYKPGSFTNNNGETFEILFDIKYEYAPDRSAINMQDGDNILEYVGEERQSKVFGTYEADMTDGIVTEVRSLNANTGEIGSQDAVGSSYQTTIHETLHFLGLSDRYDEFEDGSQQTDEGFADDILGSEGGQKMGQIHYDNIGETFSEKGNGTYIMKEKVDWYKTDGSVKGGSSDGKRPINLK